MKGYGRTLGTIGMLGVAVAALLLVPGLVAPASASPAPLTGGTSQQWAYGAQKWVNVTEDFGNGRVYLPADDLSRFGCRLEPGGEPPAQQAGMPEVIRFEAERARGWYAKGLQLMPMLDWRSRSSAGTMAGIYSRLLMKISATPQAALAHRMSLPTREKAAVAARALSGLGSRSRGSRP